jgi:hypothetical protein
MMVVVREWYEGIVTAGHLPPSPSERVIIREL